MQRLIVFNNLSLDGYFTDRNGSMSWAHGGRPDPEFSAFSARNASGGGSLIFGRVTYEMMAAFWPTEEARRQLPEVAAGMNGMTKIVFSRTLRQPPWSNTSVVRGDAVRKLRALKREKGRGLAILGSGDLVAQVAAAGIIDEYQFVIIPVVVGGGRTLFEGVRKPLFLQLAESRTFKNGRVFLRYVPSLRPVPPRAP
jgi:dihydrofolate reductase